MKNISFPKSEWKDIANRLKTKKTLITTRCGKEFNKYLPNKVYSWKNYKLKVTKSKNYESLQQHPYFNCLSNKMKKSIKLGMNSSNKYQVIWLKLIK